MTSTNTDRPTWQRKRAKKRREASAERTANHHKELRRDAAVRGQKGLAEAEWNILKATVTDLPAHLQDEEWKTIAAFLRQLAEGVRARHTK